IPPKFTFAILQPEDMVLCLCFFVAALITGSLTSQSRRHDALAVAREARTLFLYEVLQDIFQSSRPDDFLARITWRVEDLMGGELKIYLKPDECPTEAMGGLMIPIRGRE